MKYFGPKKYPTLREVFMQEISKEESLSYYDEMKIKDPELHKELSNLARLAIASEKSEEGPKNSVDALKLYLKKYEDLNPLRSADTVGVEMFIDKLIDEPKEAGKVKRYYNNIFNALLKQRYDEEGK